MVVVTVLLASGIYLNLRPVNTISTLSFPGETAVRRQGGGDEIILRPISRFTKFSEVVGEHNGGNHYLGIRALQ